MAEITLQSLALAIAELKKSIDDMLDFLDPQDSDVEDEIIPEEIPDQKNCYNISIDEFGTQIICPNERIENEPYCQKHLDEYNDFFKEVVCYVKDHLKELSDEDNAFIKTLGRSWKRELSEELDISQYEMKKIITQLKKEEKTFDEIAKALCSE